MTINYQQPYYQNPYGGIPYVYPQPPIYPFPPETSINPNQIYNEQSYIENILRLNYGKVATVYMNFENSQWGSKVFKGVIQAAGTDHIILKDVSSETRYLLLTIYLCYITFDEQIEYEYPYRNK